MAKYTYNRNLLGDGHYDISYNLENPKLHNEINIAFPNHILNKIDCFHTILDIYITPDLTVSEKDQLDNIIFNHQNAYQLKTGIFKLTNDSKNPTQRDVALFGLFRKDIFNNLGALTIKEYYKNFDGTNYSDLVVKDEYIYTYNPYGLVMYRDETLTWYLEDDSIGATKTIRKYYDSARAILEANQRRENLVNIAQAYGMANITGFHASGMHNGHHFFLSIKNEIDNYIVGVLKEDLITAIQNNTESYLTQQMKDDLIDIFDYWS